MSILADGCCLPKSFLHKINLINPNSNVKLKKQCPASHQRVASRACRAISCRTAAFLFTIPMRGYPYVGGGACLSCILIPLPGRRAAALSGFIRIRKLGGDGCYPKSRQAVPIRQISLLLVGAPDIRYAGAPGAYFNWAYLIQSQALQNHLPFCTLLFFSQRISPLPTRLKSRSLLPTIFSALRCPKVIPLKMIFNTSISIIPPFLSLVRSLCPLPKW